MTSIPENNGEDRRETWSNLPILLLWMIKDRLPFIENLMVSVVCKHWHYASKIYPTTGLQGADCRPMWLMPIKLGDEGWKDRQITNFSTRKKYYVGSQYSDSVNANATLVLCSEKGWLLLATPYFVNPKIRYKGSPSSPMFLVNPFTKQRYDLPTARFEPEKNKVFNPHAAAISTVNGIPSCAAIGLLDGPLWGNCDIDPLQFILKIARPNDKEWRTYTYRYGSEENYAMDCFPRMLMRNNHVYLIDVWGRTLAFDIFGATWTSIVKQRGERECNYIDPLFQTDAAIMRIVFKWEPADEPGRLTHCVFLKLNEDEGTWDNLDHNELIGKCWHVGMGGNYFISKDTGKTQVHYLDGREGGYWVQTYAVNLLAGGSAQMVSRHPLDIDSCENDLIWVDLG